MDRYSEMLIMDSSNLGAPHGTRLTLIKSIKHHKHHHQLFKPMKTQAQAKLRAFWKHVQLRISPSKRRSRQQLSQPHASQQVQYPPAITINGDVHIHCIQVIHMHNETQTYVYQPTNIVNTNSFNHVNSSSVGVTNDYSTYFSSSTTDIDETTSVPTA